MSPLFIRFDSWTSALAAITVFCEAQRLKATRLRSWLTMYITIFLISNGNSSFKKNNIEVATPTFSLKWTSTYFPNRLLLMFLMVFAFPNDSSKGFAAGTTCTVGQNQHFVNAGYKPWFIVVFLCVLITRGPFIWGRGEEGVWVYGGWGVGRGGVLGVKWSLSWYLTRVA